MLKEVFLLFEMARDSLRMTECTNHALWWQLMCLEKLLYHISNSRNELNVVRCFWGVKINACNLLLKERLKLDDAQYRWSSLWPQNSCLRCHLRPFECDESALMVLRYFNSHCFSQCSTKPQYLLPPMQTAKSWNRNNTVWHPSQLHVEVVYFLSADDITQYTATGTYSQTLNLSL